MSMYQFKILLSSTITILFNLLFISKLYALGINDLKIQKLYDFEYAWGMDLIDNENLLVSEKKGVLYIYNLSTEKIVGKETYSEFGVVFKKLGEDFARHPAQLYEALSYLIIFFIVAHIYWRTDKVKNSGFLLGFFFVLLWASRFIIEFFKEAQVDGREDWIFGMNTGQALSIPFILIGFYLMFRKKFK